MSSTNVYSIKIQENKELLKSVSFILKRSAVRIDILLVDTKNNCWI